LNHGAFGARDTHLTPKREQLKRQGKTATIQFASDLHLEFEHRPQDRVQVPIARGTTALVLAGDIHSDIPGMDTFVRDLARRVPIVMVAGNHELFGHELNDTYRQLKDWAASIPDVHFLENERVEIDGITFVGATLWSNFDHANPRLMTRAATMMADYAVIADRDDPRGRLRPARILAEHERSIEFITRGLRSLDPARTVVVTHHAPSLASSRVKGEDWDLLYGSDYDALIRECGPALWIHGHVHQSFEYSVGRTTIACNPRGYVGYGENGRFDPSRTITLRINGPRNTGERTV
jgi:Icc-related predicted phosphoesterase